MRKKLIFFPIFLVLLFTGCSKDDETVTVDDVQKQALEHVFSGGFNFMFSSTNTAQVKALKSKVFNLQHVIKANNEAIEFNNEIYKDDLGIGTVTVNGTMTSTETSTTGSIDLVLKELYKDYSFLYDNKTYKTNGLVTCVSKITITQSSNNASISMYSTISGNLTVSGPSYSKTLSVNLTSTFDSSKSVYRVTGTLNGGKVDYTYAAAE